MLRYSYRRLLITFDVFKSSFLKKGIKKEHSLLITFDVFKYANFERIALSKHCLLITFDVFKCICKS